MKLGALIASAVLVPCCLAAHAADDKAKDDINNYLVNVTGGAVSASNLVGVDKSGITQIETSQDLVVALQPLASGDQKAGFGLAITPARTKFLPMSGATYVGNRLAPLLGNLTFSYAQGRADIKGASYKKSAYSIDTVYYFDIEDDPVMIGSRAFAACAKQGEDQNAAAIAALVAAPPSADPAARAAVQQALEALTDKRDAMLTPCIDKALKEKTRWNAGRASLSYGAAQIKGAGTASESLGTFITLNGQYPLGPRGAAALSLRRVRHAVDTETLGSASPSFKSSSLAALRLTYGDMSGTDLRGLAEASTSKASSASAFKDTFLYAVGIDKKIYEGAWLEFRLGRNRSLEDGKQQTTGLMTLSITPTLFKYKP